MEQLKLLNIPINIDPGGTLPEIHSDELTLKISFYLLDKEQRASLNFYGLTIYKFGYPNEEAISGHRLNKSGLRPFQFFEIKQSNWIKEIEKANRVHPYHKKNLFADKKHYILPFHDSTLEVIADSYEFKNSE
ncbi:MAG: hypothetical protein JXR70_18090 [Spirochaetales bacterium]|nr:hypothetical protein [Spirochaetales bacterium]